MSNLLEHAKSEMRRAGLYGADAYCGGMIPAAVERMVEVFAAEGHSGMSAGLTLAVFDKVARFQALTPISSAPSEWRDVSEYSGEPMWQNLRQSTAFSKDGGKTWYDLDAPAATEDQR